MDPKFEFTTGEQEFYKQKEFVNEIKKCKSKTSIDRASLMALSSKLLKKGKISQENHFKLLESKTKEDNELNYCILQMLEKGKITKKEFEEALVKKPK